MTGKIQDNKWIFHCAYPFMRTSKRGWVYDQYENDFLNSIVQ